MSIIAKSSKTRLNPQVEHNGQKEYETSDGQVDPLRILKRLCIVADMVEDHVGSDHRRQHSANPIERLREIDTDLRVPRRTADGNIWVRRCLQGAQSVPNNEYGSAEAAERAMNEARPGYQGSDPIETQSPDERDLVAVVAEKPVRMSERCQGICAEVGCLEAG